MTEWLTEVAMPLGFSFSHCLLICWTVSRGQLLSAETVLYGLMQVEA